MVEYCCESARNHDKPLPIDRGWAWVIALACSGMIALLDGTFKSLGMVLVEVSERFPNHNPANILWIFTSCNFIILSSGPLAAVVMRRAGHRNTAIIGTVVWSLGMIGSAYIPLVWIMFFTHSTVCGFGASLLLMVAFLAMDPYFKNNKALAMGLMSSGSGVGGLVIPYLLTTLFENLGYSGALLVYAGLLLNMLVLATLLRPIESYHCAECRSMGGVSRRASATDSSCSKQAESQIRVESKLHHQVSQHEDMQGKDHTDCMLSLVAEDSTTRSHLGANLSEENQTASRPTGNIFSSAYTLNTPFSGSALNVAFTEQQTKPIKKTRNCASAQPKWKFIFSRTLILLGISIFLYTMGIAVLYQCIVPLGVAKGIDKETIAILIASGGAVEIPGRILNGWFADRKVISVMAQYTVCICVCGTSALLCALLSGTAGIAILMFGVSIMGTSVYSLLPTLCIELFGSENLARTFAAQLVYQSLAHLLTTPIVGFLYSHFGSWESVYFYVCGVSYTAAALSGSFLFTKRWVLRTSN